MQKAMHVPCPDPAAIHIEPFGPLFGATVTGVDLSAPLPTTTGLLLTQALNQHGVLFFRDQQLDTRQLLDVAGIWGRPSRHNPYLPASSEHEGVEVIEVSETRNVRNDAWHTDVSWAATPPRFTCLYSKELPPSGGDTVWSDAAAAYDSLPAPLAHYFETLKAVHAFDASGFAMGNINGERNTLLRQTFAPQEAEVIKINPDTGRKYIFSNEQHTRYLLNVSRTTSESLLRLLFATLELPEFQLRFRWQPATLAVWDNRSVQHRAIRDYGKTRRVLLRVTVE